MEKTIFNWDIKDFRINTFRMTQKQFADFLEVSERTVQGWESKKNCPHVIMVLINKLIIESRYRDLAEKELKKYVK